MEIQVYTLDAFSDQQQGGNSAGVVLAASDLSTAHMQRIAYELGLSETAFILPSAVANYRIRYFTPNHEVDLCGHATIASFYLMVAHRLIDAGHYRIETLAGILDVYVRADQHVFLTQTPPQFDLKINRQHIADSLGIDVDELHTDAPVQIVSTGLRDIIVPIRSLRILQRIQPDFDAITRISQLYNVVGYHLFTLDTHSDAIAQCRNFAPLYDIPEESATGTATGALICYLHQYQLIPATAISPFIIEQGYTMSRPSQLLAMLQLHADGTIAHVQVGGVATNIQQQIITLNR
ncbi:PhzF family phenazine biosynthesis protein [Paenibacillus campi]|uniref:PhzF family phenazine biosynthesis protein n=1 Tax=Paenibacillus campi TaxID=3106031 RepID=UPI002B003AD3|nr:PhzF family phenazine biosynthesis protein [Paenibacillus sp. SGZ-1014]